jgi:hypothetical protein
MTGAVPLRLRVEAPISLSNAVVTTVLKQEQRPPAEAAEWEWADASGRRYPTQFARLSSTESLAGVCVEELEAGRRLDLTLCPRQEPPLGGGIEVVDQPENGRLVINQGGFLQTIYHYGPQNFKPYFYPLTVPCVRLGPADGDETVYPKSITQDAPPDHVWHRSLWYACGDLNGVDFYLEEGGEGRIVHQEFTAVFSGPLFGGFRERLLWIAPDGRKLLADERAFVLYRLKGLARLFDLEAAFTALDDPVTFRQTIENALPLLRVADLIDEWDGGRITLADGTTGGREAFGRRASWADYSGPLVRKPGREPEWWGIAMLDHPSNRNHPSAWFARSFGTLGPNLPYFDGPLTLQPGETWRLRHRFYIHAGAPEEAGVAARCQEYANPPRVTVLG